MCRSARTIARSPAIHHFVHVRSEKGKAGGEEVRAGIDCRELAPDVVAHVVVSKAGAVQALRL